MNKRWIGVGVSIALAIIGTYLLVNYVQGADERALEGEETVEVLVINEPVARGTAAEEIEDSVETVLVPAKLQTPGSVGDLSVLAGTYTSIDLVPGEQILSTRFVTADVLVALDDFPLPDGLLEVTLSLSPERALGGALRPGDTVAVIASFTPFSLVDEEAESPEIVTEETVNEDGTVTETVIEPESTEVRTSTPSSTHLIIHEALVTNVQVERLPTPTDEATAEQSGVALAPTGNLLVSLGMDPYDVERIVFTSEFGTVWLARESETISDSATVIQTRATVYVTPESGIDQASIK
jgi:pilus assembly protein CpaB